LSIRLDYLKRISGTFFTRLIHKRAFIYFASDALTYFLLPVCQCAVHKKCHDKILGKCPGSGKESQSTIVRIFKYLINGNLINGSL